VRDTGGRVLVHCRAGVSRSVTICLAYLMFTARIRLEAAFEHVRSKRSMISPSLNFMRQLEAFEKELDTSIWLTW
jgi:dual specificity MAP kinase phosphatase